VRVQELIDLARQGDLKAIAVVLARTLPTQNVKVRVYREGVWLQVLLESIPAPEARISVSSIERGLHRCEISDVRAVVVYGREIGETAPAWTYKFSWQPLRRRTTSTSQPPRRPETSTAKGSRAPHHPVKSPPVRGRSNLWVFALGLFGFSFGGFWGLFDRQSIPVQFARLRPSIERSIGRAMGNMEKTVATVIPQPVAVRTIKTDLARVLPPPIEIPDPYPATITIKAVGDIVPGTNFPYPKLPANPDIFFRDVAADLQSADLTFGNFESVLTDYPYSAKDISRGTVFAFRAPPEYATLFQSAGFDVLNIANNHSMDFGEAGLADTVRHFGDVGIQTVGQKNQILYTRANTVPVAFIGFSTYNYHNWVNDYEGVKRLVAQAHQNAEIVVVSVHAGAEGTGAMHVRNRQEFFFGEDRGNIVRFARTAVDAGADLVLGHGPHVPRAIERYNGKLIVYSLGNFVGYETLSTDGQLAYSLILEAKLDLNGDLVSGKIIPVYLGNDGIPRIDNWFRSVGFMRDLTRSDFPNTPISIDDNGHIVLR